MSTKRNRQNHGGSNGHRSLVLFPGALGDFVCFLPTLKRLTRVSAVNILASRMEFAALTAPAVPVGSLERSEISRLFVPGGGDDERPRLYFQRYTAIYSWLGYAVPQFVDELRRATDGRARVFPARATAGGLHQIDHYLSNLGFPVDGEAAPRLDLSCEGLAWCNDFWRRHRLRARPILAMAPGSGAREKNWRPEYFETVGNWWRRETGGEVVVIVGPVEEERGGYECLRRQFLTAGDLTLSQLAHLLSRCDLYLGNDSGVTHLAAAVGVRTVALFGPSDMRQWAPRGDRVSLLTRGIGCSPCTFANMKSCIEHDCLTGLKPDFLLQEMRKLPEIASLTRVGAGITVISGIPGN